MTKTNEKKNGYRIIWNSGSTYEKRYDKPKTENQLRWLAVSKVVNSDWNTRDFRIEYVD